MDTLEPNMYVRTKDGHIDKIIDTTEEWYELDGDEEEKPYKIYKLNKYYYDKEFDEETKWFLERFFVKASHNIIDLIEVGDYVNGYRVISINVSEIVGHYSYVKCINDNVFKENEIKSIVTKEQFESMSYRVEE